MHGRIEEARPADGPSDAEFTSWVRAYGPALRRFFARRVNPGDADEMVQDVFLAVHARHSGSPVDNPQGYLFRAARRLLARRRPDGRFGDADDLLDFGCDPLSPERRLIGKQELERALRAIEKLPPRTREAFILHRFEEMTYANIAYHLGISISAVKKLMSRSLRLILAEIGQPQ